MPISPIPPPAGVTQNFVNPEQKGEEIYYLGIVGMIFSTLFLILRIYTKLRINRQFGGEDVCVIGAWICSVTTVILTLSSFRKAGEGRHMWNVTLDQFALYQKFVLSSSVIYVPCLGLAKTSILLIFRRLSPNKGMHFAINTVMFLVVGYSIAIVFCLIFPCRPYRRAWDATITEGWCLDRPAIYVSTAVANIVTDLAILTLPIPMVIKLKIPLQQKIGLAGMFAVGSLTFVTSVIRLVTLKPLFVDIDQTWVVVTPAIWIVVEANLVIICCCFLAVKSFLREHAPSLIGEKLNSSGYKANTSYEDRHNPPRGLVIKKDIDFNLSWQDDSRVRIHQYDGTQTDPAEAGRDLEMDPITRPSPATKGTRDDGAHVRGGSADEKGIENENGVEGLGRNTKSSSVNAITPMSPV